MQMGGHIGFYSPFLKGGGTSHRGEQPRKCVICWDGSSNQRLGHEGRLARSTVRGGLAAGKKEGGEADNRGGFDPGQPCC